METAIDPRNEWHVDYALHPGQVRAMSSEARIVAVVAAARSGKTVLGPLWMMEEIRARGPGDYLVAGPHYPLLDKKVIPELRRYFNALGLGHYSGVPSPKYVISQRAADNIFGYKPDVPTQIFFGHASKSESLASMTVKAAWLDEAGQKEFRLESWEEIQRRVSIHQGRILITTTPYSNLSWLKSQVVDRAVDDPDIDVINFDALENPAFPEEEYWRAKERLPEWKFDMFFRGLFTRPAGMVYDCFDEELHVVEPFKIPRTWRRYLGMDFGGVNTAAVFAVEDPADKVLYFYRDYHAGGRTCMDHVRAMKNGEDIWPVQAFGGARSEIQWRAEMGKAGLHVECPRVAEVDVGIGRVYEAIKTGQVRVFKTCYGLLDEIGSYAYKVDEIGEPTDEIENKSQFHRADAIRYLLSSIRIARTKQQAARPVAGTKAPDRNPLAEPQQKPSSKKRMGSRPGITRQSAPRSTSDLYHR